MELREYWNIIRRRWWLPVAITLVALIASTAVGLRGAAAYKTDMRVAISTIPTPDPNAVLYYDPTYYSNLDSEYLADDMSELHDQPRLRRRSPARARHQQHAVRRRRRVTIVNATRTKKTHRFIDITITTPTFEQGQQIAGSISRILQRPGPPGHLPQGADGLQHADDRGHAAGHPPREHAAGPGQRDRACARVIGLLVGIGLAFLIDYVDPSLRSRQEAEAVLQLPVLGEIPRTRRGVAA